MQSGESLFYLLLSIAVLVTQCLLGMGDCYVLTTQWLLAGALSASIIFSINSHRIHVFSTDGLLQLCWVLMASVFNLCQIHLVSSLPWWQVDLLLVSFTLLFMLSIGSWLTGDNPIRFILGGMIIGLCTIIYPQALLWLVLFIWQLFYMRNFTVRNMWSIISGTILMIWINYCVMLFAFGTDEEYLESFMNLASWHLPDVVFHQSSMIYTPWVFLAFSVMILVVCIMDGMFSNVVSSLRTHATMVSTVTTSIALLLFMVIDPSAIVLYVCMASVLVSMNLALVVSNVNISLMRWWITFVVVMLILLGFAEYAINYLLTL